MLLLILGVSAIVADDLQPILTHLRVLGLGLTLVLMVWIFRVGNLGAAIVATTPASVPEEPSVAEQILACPACGAVLTGTESDCSDCGLHLTDG